MSQTWTVVGGEDTGGILVREGRELSSPKTDKRLAHGAKVEQLAIGGDRLNFKLLEGEGPATGWVSISIKGKDLLTKVSDEPVEELPPREPGSEALLNLVTIIDGKKQGTWKLKVPADVVTVGDWKAGVRSQKLLKDDTVAKFADKLSIKRYFGVGKMGPKLADEAQLPVDPAQVFVTGPGAIQGALARGIQDDFGEPYVPEARRLCVKSTSPALHGGYEETFGESQIFVKKGSMDTPMTLFREQDKAGGGTRWFFGDNSSSFASFVMKSNDDAASPEDAKWPSEIQKIAFFDEKEAEADDALFQDGEFPHVGESVGKELEAQLRERPQWIPARRLGSEDMKLFDGIDPTDLLQGQIGDCWLIAAMAGMAEFPTEVQRLFVDRGNKTPGRYVVKLFDHRQGDFAEVAVDEFVPCLPKQWWELEGTPFFARPNGSEMWCVLLEKAMAKLFGNYASLIANNCGVAFRAFTGALDNFMYMKPQAAGGAWLKYKIMPKGFDYDPCMHDPDYRLEPDAFFDVLAKDDKESFLMSASLQISHSMEYRRSDGLMEGHAYSLLKVEEVDGQRLLLMRNPWGNDCEWNGAWSDSSDMWDKYPKVKETLRPSFQSDGLFWMDWNDFNRIWDMVNVCHKTMRTGEDMFAHMKAASFVTQLGKKEKQRKPRRAKAILKTTLMLKVAKSGEDPTEAAALPSVEVSAEKLLRSLLGRIFQELDKSGDGKLQLAEAIAGLTEIFGVDSEQIKRGQEVFQALDDLDSTNSGELSAEEFIQAGLDFHGNASDNSVLSAMKSFNATHSLWAAIRAMKLSDSAGNIGKEEIGKLLQEAEVKSDTPHPEEFWQQVAAQLIAEKDQDNDGCLNIQEWMSLMGNMTSLCNTQQEKSRADLHENAGRILAVGKAIQKLKDPIRTRNQTASSGSSGGEATKQGAAVEADGLRADAPADALVDDAAGGPMAVLEQMGRQLQSMCQGCWAGLRA